MSCKTICSKGTSCIEAEPSEPEGKCAKSNEWNVMNTISSILITFSSAKDNRKYQCTYTGADMYDISACKINGTDLCKETALSPYHMCHRVVNQNRPEHDKEE